MATTNITGSLYYLPFFIFAFIIHSLFRNLLKPGGNQTKLPPMPPALPFIGHLHLLGSVLPKSFQTLARRYGPLMRLRLGASSCVIVSNTAVAKEIFKTHDLSFASRPEFGSSEYFKYRGSRFLLAPYGDYWRFMKKLCMARLLGVPQLEKFTEVREQEKEKLVESLMRICREGKMCDLGSELIKLTNNTICRMAMSTRVSESNSEAKEVKELVKTCLALGAKLSVGDVLGPLKILDFSGTGKKLAEAIDKYDQLMEKIIREHEEKASKGFDEYQRKDILDILLEIYRDPTAEIKLSKNDIKSFMLVSIICIYRYTHG